VRRPINAWPDTDKSRGVLFVAQLLREMLHPDSFESFRVHSLDTLARITEALRVLEDVTQGRLPAAALDPIIEELEWSLRRDPVAGAIAPDEIDACGRALKDSRAKQHLHLVRAALQFLEKHIAPHYKQALETKILELFDTNKKKDLRACVSAYGSFLVNRGYSRRFLAREVEGYFFSEDVVRAGSRTLQGFFRRLDCVDKRFSVCAAVSADFGRYLTRLPDARVMPLAELPPHAASAFSNLPNHERSWLYLERQVQAKDDHSAGTNLHLYISSVQAMTFLSRRGVPMDWHSGIYAFKPRATQGRFVRTEAPRLQKNVVPTGQAIRSLQAQSNQILGQFDAASTERLVSSINTCALARSSTDKENALISLWSAVEVLLSDPPPNTPRIIHYVEKLVPAICLKYVRRYIIAVTDELQVSYRRRFLNVLSRVTDEHGSDPYTKFTHLMFDAGNEEIRARLFEACSDNPLACHRLWKLHSDFATPDALAQSLEHHQSRVAWQLHRIYRARNELVHSGRVPAYLSSLVVNAFEYYRSALLTLLGHASKESAPSDIDQSIAEIGLTYVIYKDRIAKAKGKAFLPADFGAFYK
jgi:hypothetical protein